MAVAASADHAHIAAVTSASAEQDIYPQYICLFRETDSTQWLRTLIV